MLPPSLPGTLQHFLLERYVLFSLAGGKVWRGQVHHTPYPAYDAKLLQLSQTMLPAAGLSGAGEQPAFIHHSPGVDVEVFALRPIV
jgi:uncharacterized protein